MEEAPALISSRALLFHLWSRILMKQWDWSCTSHTWRQRKHWRRTRPQKILSQRAKPVPELRSAIALLPVACKSSEAPWRCPAGTVRRQRQSWWAGFRCFLQILCASRCDRLKLFSFIINQPLESKTIVRDRERELIGFSCYTHNIVYFKPPSGHSLKDGSSSDWNCKNSCL